MAAHYDSYDYPSYWLKREYEHQAEVIAITEFLSFIPSKLKHVVEIGCGYGRVVPTYLYRAEKVTLTDPSAKLLGLARKNLNTKKIRFIQTRLENIFPKLRKHSADLVILIRVLHHLPDLEKALSIISTLTKKNGYLILEFANKMHAKAAFTQITHGDFTFPLDIFPRDIRSKKSIRQKTIPFINYHPDLLYRKLEASGFKIIEIRSVSNVRSSFLKKVLPKDLLISLERRLQKPLAKYSFGPSIFIFAKKV